MSPPTYPTFDFSSPFLPKCCMKICSVPQKHPFANVATFVAGTELIAREDSIDRPTKRRAARKGPIRTGQFSKMTRISLSSTCLHQTGRLCKWGKLVNGRPTATIACAIAAVATAWLAVQWFRGKNFVPKSSTYDPNTGLGRGAPGFRT